MKEKHSGFTLVEAMVALAIVLLSVVSAIGLITRGIYAFSSSRNKIIASNLAQEGIELIQLIRDNNIACDWVNGPPTYQWDADPAGGLLPVPATEVDIQQAFVPISCGAQQIYMPPLNHSCTRVLLYSTSGPSAGTYGYQSGSPTPFSRCVTIERPPNSLDTPPIPSGDQLDVISTVTWTERGQAKTSQLRKRLYNWR